MSDPRVLELFLILFYYHTNRKYYHTQSEVAFRHDFGIQNLQNFTKIEDLLEYEACWYFRSPQML